MEYRKIEGHAYNLHLINTDKFKKNIIKINFRGKLVKEDIVKRKLITSTLLDSNSIYKSKRLLDIRTEELYNLSGYNETYITGNSLVTSLTATFLNDKYCNESIFEECIKFQADLLLKPLITNNKFNHKAYERAVKLIIEDIKSIKEDPKVYANNRILEEMDNGIFSYRDTGYLEDLEDINEKNLYEYYLDMIKTNKIDIFVIGNIHEYNIEKMIRDNYDFNTIKKMKISPFIYHTRFRKRYRKVVEEFDTVQSTLKVGYKIEKMTSFEYQYVLPIYNYILGGGPDSKLFRNVREKNSLCYSISSSARMISNALIITSFIDKGNFNKAFKLIKKEFEDMDNGNFDEEDIDKAKAIYLNVYKEIEDSEASILEQFIAHEYYDTDLYKEKAKNIMKVDKKMILKLAHKIHPDTVYLLEGVKNEEE